MNVAAAVRDRWRGRSPERSSEGRPLVGAEELFWRLDEMCPMNFAVHARLTGRLNESRLERAVEHVQARHPMLQVRIEPRGSRPWFVSSREKIDVRLDASPAPALPGIYAREGSTAFDTLRGPLARVVLVRHDDESVTLILTFHHAIADAKSGLLVLREILLASSAEAGVRGDAPSSTAVPGQWARFPPKARGVRGWVSHSRPLLRFMAAALRHPPVDLGASAAAIRTAVRSELHVVSRELDPSITRRIVQRARLERTSVHAALQASMALALVDVAGCELPARALFGSAVCLRSRLEPAVGDVCGNYASGVAWIDEVSEPGSFWAMARRLKASLDGAIARDEDLLAIPYTNRVHAWVGRRIGRRSGLYARYLSAVSPHGVMVSNAGRWPYETSFGALKLESAGFFANQSLLGNVALLAVTVGERLVLDFVGAGPDASEALVRRVADRCARALVEATRDSALPVDSPLPSSAPERRFA